MGVAILNSVKYSALLLKEFKEYINTNKIPMMLLLEEIKPYETENCIFS